MVRWFIGLCLVVMIITANPPVSHGTSKGLRVISLAPAATEILFALGLDEEIVGVSQFCDYPQKALTKERIGTFSDPNIENIVSLKPDIIFCAGLEQAPTIIKLKQLGLKVCVSDPSTIEELFGSIQEIGQLIGKEARAKALIDEMRGKVADVCMMVSQITPERRPKVFIEIGHNPLMSAGKGSIIDELVTAAGGINIAHNMKAAYGSFSAEDVVQRNPDCIILAYMQKGDIVTSVGKRLGWKGISAVQKHHVYNDIDPNILVRPGPRIIEGLKELHKRFYP